MFFIECVVLNSFLKFPKIYQEMLDFSLGRNDQFSEFEFFDVFETFLELTRKHGLFPREK